MGKVADLTTEDKCAEFEAIVDVSEERRQLSPLTAVFKVEEAGNTPSGGDRPEETGCSLVGVNAGGSEQTHNAVWLNQINGAFDK